MPVKIEISGDNAAQAYRELCDFTHLSSAVQAAPATATSAEVPKQTRGRNTSKPVTAEPEKAASAEEQVDDGPAGGNAASDEPIPTDVELRAAAQAAGAKDGGRAAVKALLDQYGAPNITAVPADQRIAFKRDLGAI